MLFSETVDFHRKGPHVRSRLLISGQSRECFDCPLIGLELFFLYEILSNYEFEADNIKVLKFESVMELVRPISFSQFNLERL